MLCKRQRITRTYTRSYKQVTHIHLHAQVEPRVLRIHVICHIPYDRSKIVQHLYWVTEKQLIILINTSIGIEHILFQKCSYHKCSCINNYTHLTRHAPSENFDDYEVCCTVLRYIANVDRSLHVAYIVFILSMNTNKHKTNVIH